MRDLLVNVQRTCKQWKAVLDGSRKLQQAMFFQPITDQGVHYHSNSLVDNPSRVIAHPFIQDLETEHLHDKYKYSKSAGLWRPDASWRRQLVSQPPASQLTVHVRSDMELYRCGCGHQVYASELGITWEDIRSAIANNHQPYTVIIVAQSYWLQSDLEKGPTYGDMAAVKKISEFKQWTSRREEVEE